MWRGISERKLQAHRSHVKPPETKSSAPGEQTKHAARISSAADRSGWSWSSAAWQPRGRSTLDVSSQRSNWSHSVREEERLLQHVHSTHQRKDGQERRDGPTRAGENGSQLSQVGGLAEAQQSDAGVRSVKSRTERSGSRKKVNWRKVKVRQENLMEGNGKGGKDGERVAEHHGGRKTKSGGGGRGGAIKAVCGDPQQY